MAHVFDTARPQADCVGNRSFARTAARFLTGPSGITTLASEDLVSLASPGSVLLVEDDADVRRLIGDQLVRMGYKVTQAASMRECLQELQTVSPVPEVMLLDRYLPDGDGCEILRRTQSGGDLPQLPVVVISVDPSADGMSEVLAAGAVDYLVKPFEGKVMAARLAAAVREARQKRALLRTQQVLAGVKCELELIFDAVEAAILLVDANLIVRRINRAGMSIAGRPSYDQVVGQPCHLAVFGSAEPCEDCPALAVLHSGGQASAEISRKRDGKLTCFSHRACFLKRSEDGDGMVVVVAEDVTSRRDLQMEKARAEKLEAVMRMAGGLAHEISQPLAAVSGRAELLEMALRDQGDPEMRRHLDNLRSNSKRLGGIVRRLQSMSDFVTKPYYGGTEIVDLELSCGDDDRVEGGRAGGAREKGA
jgi:CheY-like chemotaxis protein